MKMILVALILTAHLKFQRSSYTMLTFTLSFIKNKIKICIARAGVIGGGDWATGRDNT